MLKPIDKIDTVAMEAARSVELLVYALDGLFEQTVRENPSIRGVQEFHQNAERLVDESINTIMGKLSFGYHDLQASLSDSERAYVAELDALDLDSQDVRATLWGAFTSVRNQYVKRLREIVAARAFGTDTFNPDPKVMTRNGRRWNFVDYGYLTARMILVDRWNQIKIGYIASIGGTQFTLDTEDPALIQEVYNVEDFPAVSEELFHPRTSKLVGGIYVST